MKKFLTILALAIVAFVVFAFVYFLVRDTDDWAEKDVFTPAPQEQFIAPIQDDNGKG